MISEEQAKKYCSEDISLIENYAEAIADTTQMWVCHHRAEILPCGRYYAKQLKMHNLYKNVPASHLIFLTPSKHHSLHAKNRPEEWRAKQRAINQGTNNPMYGKKLSMETREKMRMAHAGNHWWNDGSNEILSRECPGDGRVRGRI